MQFNTEQLKAIGYGTDTKRRIVAVSGQAGTGKTTIIRLVSENLTLSKRRTVVLAAPTGRAARRIYEATGIPAFTIHKLLGYGKPEVDEKTGQPKEVTVPAYDRLRPLPYQDVIVDEYAMVNHELHRNLLDALPSRGRLLAFGDNAQLPPIEEHAITDGRGNVKPSPFQELMTYPSAVQLTHVYRQGEDSGILYNAQRIRNGIPPVKRGDFGIETTDTPILNLRRFVFGAFDNGIDFSSLSSQIITPARKGKLGVYYLNGILQTILHTNSSSAIPIPRDKWLEEYPTTFDIGEKVICNENIYDLRDFWSRFSVWDGDEPDWSSFIPCPDTFQMLNGEIGVINDILPDGSLDIDFGDRIVSVPASYRDHIPRFNRIVQRDPRKKLDLAYAVTTHKMQGSECDHVCYVMHRSINYNLSRNNLYTGVTRAKKTVHLICDSNSLSSSVRLTAEQKDAIMRRTKPKPGPVFGDMS